MKKGMHFLMMSCILAMSFGSNVYAKPAEMEKLRVEGGKALQIAVKEKQEENEKIIQENMENEKGVIKVYQNLQKHVYDKKNNKYHESYAGSYVNNAGNLVIQVKDKNKASDYIEEALQSDENIVVEEVENSFNELECVYESISNEINTAISNENIQDNYNNITGVEISEQDNSVIVYLDECGQEEINDFKNEILNDDCIEFKEGELAVPTATSVHPGQSIVVGDGGYSMGIRAYYINSLGNKVKGFITAGHNVSKGEAAYVVTSSGNWVYVGKVTKVKVGGSVDAAFVKLENADCSLSNKVYYKTANNCSTASGIKLDVESWWWDIPVGSTVYKAGFKGYCTSGTVLSKNNTVNYDLNGDSIADVSIGNMIKSTYLTRSGDSGGIVYAYDKSPVGIQSGCDTNSYNASTGYYSISYCSNIDNILELNWGKDGLWLY